MFNFLKGKMGGFGGMGNKMGGAQQGGGFMDKMRAGLQRPQMQQALGGMGAQMMGLDPRMGMAAAQGMQQRRINQGFDRAIQPIERMRMNPSEFLPNSGIQPLGGGSIIPTPTARPKPSPFDMGDRSAGPVNFEGGRREYIGPSTPEPPFGPQPPGPKMDYQPQGGGSWQDPRMQELFGRLRNRQTY